MAMGWSLLSFWGLAAEDKPTEFSCIHVCIHFITTGYGSALVNWLLGVCGSHEAAVVV